MCNLTNPLPFVSTAVTFLAAVAGLSNTALGGSFGADACTDVVVHAVTPGPVGSPTVTVSSGDLTTATGPDCSFGSDDGIALYWEAFELEECATVTIELCGTVPLHFPSRNYLYTQCPSSGTDCGTPILADAQNRFTCSDSNIWLQFGSLEPGTYYYPIIADPDAQQSPPDTYQITIRAEQCAGACCDFTLGTCTDGALQTDCSGPNQVFHGQEACCSVDCIPPGDTYASSGVELLSNVPLSGFSSTGLANDIWGYTSPSGREYALIGLNSSTAVVEVTDPFNPVVIDQVFGPSCTWRDIKTLDTYAYSVNDCEGGMDIIDLARVDEGIVELVRRWTGSGFQDAHNIYINEQSGYAYVGQTNLGSAGLIAINLANPENPSVSGSWPTASVHDQFVISYDSGPYSGREIAFNSSPGYGVAIVDVTNKSNMFELSRTTYPGMATTHQGWITQDRQHFLFGDEGDEFGGAPVRLYAMDVSDLKNPILLPSYSNGTCTIDHNLIIRGGLTYQANYSTGLRVFDTTDPANIEEVAYFDTYPSGNEVNFVGAWGVYPNLPSGVAVVSDMNRGLFVLNYDCNGNGIDDTNDIADLTSADCNANGLPDECEFDCDADGEPDQCQIAADPGLDGDGDGLLDSCACSAIPNPQMVTDDPAKSRYLTMIPGNGGVETALRVTLGDLSGFPGQAGRELWVGPPQAYPEEIASAPGTTFMGARLTCQPHFRDWGTVGVLHVFGGEIVPGTAYEVHAVPTNCADALDTGVDLGAGLAHVTGTFADVAPPFAADPGAPSQPDFNDISGVVAKFLAEASAPIKAQAQLQPNVVVPQRAIDFKDIATAVSAFLGVSYAELPASIGPCACPSSVTCGATACGTDAACGNGICIEGFCTDACGRCTP